MLCYREVKSLFLLTSDGTGKKKSKTDSIYVQVGAPVSAFEPRLDTWETPAVASLKRPLLQG